MAYEVKVHDAQSNILRELLFRMSAGYAELQKPTGLSSDHFNFHITRLVDIGYVEKVTRGQYRLTPHGKEYANKLDTDAVQIERQPKSAVILGIRYKNKWLFQERLKHPYYGFWGFPSGKIRWGEKITEAAERESIEETGLSGDFKLMGTYHELVYQAETGKSLEDKIFHVMFCDKPKGELVKKFEGGRNAWLTSAEAKTKKKIFESYKFEVDIALGKLPYIERKVKYTKDAF